VLTFTILILLPVPFVPPLEPEPPVGEPPAPGAPLLPVPDPVTAKSAVRSTVELGVKVQLLVPLHGPFQPWNVDPDCGVAVNVTGTPGGS